MDSAAKKLGSIDKHNNEGQPDGLRPGFRRLAFAVPRHLLTAEALAQATKARQADDAKGAAAVTETAVLLLHTDAAAALTLARLLERQGLPRLGRSPLRRSCAKRLQEAAARSLIICHRAGDQASLEALRLVSEARDTARPATVVAVPGDEAQKDFRPAVASCWSIMSCASTRRRRGCARRSKRRRPRAPAAARPTPASISCAPCVAAVN